MCTNKKFSNLCNLYCTTTKPDKIFNRRYTTILIVLNIIFNLKNNNNNKRFFRLGSVFDWLYTIEDKSSLLKFSFWSKIIWKGIGKRINLTIKRKSFNLKVII